MRDSNKPLYAIDFGTGEALAIHGPGGAVKKPKFPPIKGGKTPRDELRLILFYILNELGDVVMESSTPGSSGAEINDIKEITEQSKNQLFVLSTRAVKNFLKDQRDLQHQSVCLPSGKCLCEKTTKNKKDKTSHAKDAEILYKIATEMPWRLREWRSRESITRTHRHARPMDKRKYNDNKSNALMATLPLFEDLPKNLQESPLGKVLQPATKKRPAIYGYNRKFAIPFAQALTEPVFLENPTRNMFETIIGSFEHGYPSHYRQMLHGEWSEENAIKLAGVKKNKDVPRSIRTVAQRLSQKERRQFFHLAMEFKKILKNKTNQQ